MREQVISVFPDDPGMLKDRQKYFLKMDEIYTHDAYHSLSIEGYRVSYELIEKIRSGRWNPDNDPDDFQQLQALTAKGYFNAFTAVKKSIGRILDGESPGDVAESDLQKWYHALFSTLVETGSMKQYDLLGYRNDRVFIRSSLHVPPPSYALTDSMNAFFSLMKSETGAGVRAVLGHFMFTFIHPYMDGNGRIARFLMNVMLASGGFDWTVIRTENRDEYMNALETASVKGDIRPFAEFVLTEMRVEWGKQNQAF
jgi:Fic family protein